MATQIPVKTVSPEEYLVQEEQATERHEYIKGEITPMPGGTLQHSELSGNLYSTLKFTLKKLPYKAYIFDQRLWIPSQQVYTYPDVMVVPKPVIVQEGRKDTVLNACLVAEVLSPSTKNYDQSEKFRYYRSIPEFQDYLLIEQDRVFVEHYSRVDIQKWSLTEYTNIEDIIPLESLGCEVAIADIYEDVEF